MNLKPRRGYALATILILLGVCMFGAAALVTISVLESKISRSQLEGTVAYYAAESGITDAIWRLNTTAAYRNALNAGTLNVTYNVSNQPASGQGFSVTMVTSAQGAGYATIDVTGTSNNGNFTAKRQVESNMFLGSGDPLIGNNAFLVGKDNTGTGLTITNGGSALTVTNGDVFSRGTITINQATLNAGTNLLKAVGNYTVNNSVITSGGIFAANRPPAPTDIAIPGYNFAQYSALPTNKCTAAKYAAEVQLRCTAAQFKTLITGSSTFTFPNQVVYIDQAETMNNSVAQNKTLNFTGLFVVNGALTVSASGLHININDPGNGKSGLMVAGNMTNTNGVWVVNGVYYSSGTSQFNNANAITVDGAVVSGSSMSINTGASFTANFNPDRAGSVLGGNNSGTAVQVLHWEEEY